MTADFSFALDRWADQIEGRAKLFAIALAENLVSYIQDRTPVLTGRLRASIQPTKPLSDWQPGEPIVIGTGLDYARRIEYGFTGTDSLGRHYVQKGAGMFTQAAANFDEIVEMTLEQIGTNDEGTKIATLSDVVEEMVDAAMGGAYEKAWASMSAASGAGAYAESMASIAEAAAEFGIFL